MRIVVIGGTGHIGSYLVPRLVTAGHDIVVITRGERSPYHSDAAWERVERVHADRAAEDADGTFGARIVDLAPDAVVDLVCFTVDSARALAEAVQGRVGHLLHCGTIWVHGPAAEVPTTEDASRRPFGAYGIAKNEIEAYLLRQSRVGGTPSTVLHPGHISGPGWPPIGPTGNLDLDVFGKLARGEQITLPDLGLETVHHVHADDVAQGFCRAIERRSLAVGEVFHVCARRAVTLRGYAEAVAAWFGQEPRLAFAPYDVWRGTVSDKDAATTYDHIAHAPTVSIAKAERLLGFAPRYSGLQAARSALAWLVDEGRVDTGGRLLSG